MINTMIIASTMTVAMTAPAMAPAFPPGQAAAREIEQKLTLKAHSVNKTNVSFVSHYMRTRKAMLS